MLFPDRLAAFNRVSGKRVQDIPLATAAAAMAGAAGAAASAVSGGGGLGLPLGLVKDEASGTLYLFGPDALHEVVVSNEGRDMWKVRLEGPADATAWWQGFGVSVWQLQRSGSHGRAVLT